MRTILMAMTLVLSCLGMACAQSIQTNADVGNQQSDPYFFGRLRVNAHFGWAYRLGKNGGRNSVEQAYINKLRSGFQLGLSATFHVKPNWGLGLHYQRVSSSYDETRLHEKIYTNFLGPSFYMRSKPLGKNRNWAFFSTVSLGYLHYEDQAEIASESMVRSVSIVGETMGTYVDAGFECRLYNKLYLMGGVSLLQGTITVSDQTVNSHNLPGNKINASNLGLFLGLRGGF